MIPLKKLVLPKFTHLKVGDIVSWGGCFTFEPYIRYENPERLHVT